MKTCIHCNQHHRIPSGKGSLLEVSEILVLHSEGIKEIAPCYEKELRSKLNATCGWMISIGWTKEDVVKLLNVYKQQVLDAQQDSNGVVNDVCIDCSSIANRDHFNTDEYEDGYYQYQEQLEDIVSKSCTTTEAKVFFWKGIIHKTEKELVQLRSALPGYQKQLSLHDRIQDAIDEHLPRSCGSNDPKAKVVFKYWNRLNVLYSKKELDFSGLHIFVNQLRAILGRPLRAEPKYPVQSPADKIRYLEKKIEDRMELIKYAEFRIQACIDAIYVDRPIVSGIRLESEDLGDLIEEIEKADNLLLCCASTNV